jgi:DNA polymerase/3'-5' exonuclease PolX
MKNMWKYLGDIYRTEAYNSAIIGIQNTRSLEGLGASLKKKAKEIMETGKLSSLNDMKQIVALYGIPGFGKKTLQRMTKEKGKMSMKEYLTKHKSELTDQQKLGLKYYKRLNKNLDRDYVKYITDKLRKFLDTHNMFSKMTVAGGYRRGNNSMKDIDIIIVPESDVKSRQITSLIVDNFIAYDNDKEVLRYEATVVSGDTKFSFYIRSTKYVSPSGKSLKKLRYEFIHVDIRYVSSVEYPAALLYFTGNRTFNIILRRKAINMGYKLNEYGLWRDGERMPIHTELDILNVLEMKKKYDDPKNRNK